MTMNMKNSVIRAALVAALGLAGTLGAHQLTTESAARPIPGGSLSSNTGSVIAMPIWAARTVND
ncbi:hypothetical protein [Streptomyces sp. BE303]|uniref:hypothetical protein n=1 Tax=Streptomycetaceae TaxID=2062 RepID=UPI002E7727ED|nr:hypothetical protein [Streptomyces sp. BE303]MED7947885.1 hypothetical protein [Streptomyces sp. BE303]